MTAVPVETPPRRWDCDKAYGKALREIERKTFTGRPSRARGKSRRRRGAR